ncbi:MAG: hypothetical protein H0Z24_05760 [Thermosipho sp. (in: Bacteria)]|nr:hypothetical protein [Thermosipho sp. (in: thermotogales)]
MKQKQLKRLVESLDVVIRGLTDIRVILSGDLIDSESVQEEKPLEVPANETPAKEGVSRKDELESMKYNDLKKLCKDLGLSPKGKKDVLIERILNCEETKEEIMQSEEGELEPELQEVVEENEVEEESTEEPEENEVEIEEDSEEEETLYEKVERELADYTLEELAEILESVGKSPKGKRQALIAKIVDAIEEGLLEFDSEDEEEIEEEDNEEVEEDNTEVEEETTDDEDIEEEMTEARRKTIEELVKEIKRQYKEGELSDKEIKATLEQYNEYSETCSTCNCPKEDRLKCYIDLYTSLVDDEGNMHELQEVFYRNGEPVCCGKYLVELNNGNYYCEVCGTEYETE